MSRAEEAARELRQAVKDHLSASGDVMAEVHFKSIISRHYDPLVKAVDLVLVWDEAFLTAGSHKAAKVFLDKLQDAKITLRTELEKCK